MARRLPTSLQISNAKKLFCRSNPPCDDIDMIDFESVIDAKSTYSENLEALENEYPQYDWSGEEKMTPAIYEKEVIAGLQEEADPYSYDIVKKYKLENLQRAEGRSKRLSKKLLECEERPTRKPSRPGKCRVKQVEVISHKRCLPRR